MLLKTKELIEDRTRELILRRQESLIRPGLALIWVGNDPQTKSFIRVKQQKAKLLGCDFYLHHLETASLDQLKALMVSLNKKKEVHGIVLQLPLPDKAWIAPLVELMDPQKDIDHLRADSPYPAPTPSGILQILEYNRIDLGSERVVILGAGRLVGAPLAAALKERSISFRQIPRNASQHIEEIKKGTVLVSGTGVKNLVGPDFVTKDMVVVDGSGVDVDVAAVEPLVRAVSPSKGAVGPMTVCQLFDNLLIAAMRLAR